MKRSEVIDRIRTLEPMLRRQGVAAVYLYGSHARDTAHEDSDVDIFVDPVDDDAFGFEPSMRAFALLEGAFPGLDVGYGTRENIPPSFRPPIEQSALKVF